MQLEKNDPKGYPTLIALFAIGVGISPFDISSPPPLT